MFNLINYIFINLNTQITKSDYNENINPFSRAYSRNYKKISR